ncbi:MAG: hypothetical protein WC899_12875, partial [bacterium]
MRKLVVLVSALAILGMTAPAHALFTNGGFENGPLSSGWTVEHGFNRGLVLTGGVPTEETIGSVSQYDAGNVPGWMPGGWAGFTTGYGTVSDAMDNITTGTGSDTFITALSRVKYGLHSAVVNYNGAGYFDNLYGYPNFNGQVGNEYRATRIWQQDTVKSSDFESGRAIVRFAWAAVLEDPEHPAAEQPYVHVTLRNVTQGTVLYSKFYYSNQPDITWRTDNVSSDAQSMFSTILWVDWQEEDLDITDNVALGDTLRIEASAAGCAQGGHFGYVYLDGFRSRASAEGGGTTLTLDKNGMGDGLIGTCGMVVGRDGKGPMSAGESA